MTEEIKASESTGSSDSRGRNLYISEIEPKDAERIIQAIRDINKEDDEKESKIVGYIRKPIEITINSYGGWCYEGYGIIAAIESSKTDVDTICMGSAMSMGLAIFMAGRHRIAHPLDTFMYHAVSGGTWGQTEMIKRSVEEMDRLQGKYDRYLLNRSNLTQKQLDGYKNKIQNWYFDGSDAMRYGIVTRLIGAPLTIYSEVDEDLMEEAGMEDHDLPAKKKIKTSGKPRWVKN